MSPGGIGSESDLESVLTLSANDSMACLFTSVRWNDCKYCGPDVQEGGHTSWLSRIRQRDLAIDLSGPKALAESLTPQNSSVVEDAVDL